MTDPARRKEIYTFTAPWCVYGLSWSSRPNLNRLAMTSFQEKYTNKVMIAELDPEKNDYVPTAEFDHPYPATRVMWIPDRAGQHQDLLATSGDYLRIWQVSPEGVQAKCLLSNNKNSEYCAPLTSFDWNETDPNIIGTSSIDTTCTIWDVRTQQAKTQLIAHDKEVYDIAFHRGVDVFASVGADGSVRLFDLRSLEHSTIIYESPELVPLMRLSWNKQDPNYLATFTMDSPRVIVLDVRMPSVPISELEGHTGAINAFDWAPHSSCHICTAADDNQVLIWDLTTMKKVTTEPILSYRADAEVNQISWSHSSPDCMAIAFGNTVQALSV